jgi:hypothetical protein
MTNRNKTQSRIDGKMFIRQALSLEAQVLAKKLEQSCYSITHDGVMGEVNEQHFIEVLRRYLPRRYNVSRGIVIDSQGSTSDQIDIVIYDPQCTTTILDQQDHRYVLAEAVYAVLEVKPEINIETLQYSASKAQSVRALKPTSYSIVHSDKASPTRPKAFFPILAGLVAIRTGWQDGLQYSRFQELHGKYQGKETLSLGLALEDQAFALAYETFDLELTHGELEFSGPACSLAWFLFTLLKRLQDLGTCPAVDWNQYRGVLSEMPQGLTTSFS